MKPTKPHPVIHDLADKCQRAGGSIYHGERFLTATWPDGKRSLDVRVDDPNAPLVPFVCSGGQTGADRAALDVAIELCIMCGGWCPKGRRAEDGRIPDCYPLQEAASADYRLRTEFNVRDSDGTLVLTIGEPTGGTALTVRLAQKQEKPCLVVDLGQEPDIARVREWVAANGIKVLNVAGARESKQPGIHDKAAEFLRRALSRRETNEVR